MMQNFSVVIRDNDCTNKIFSGIIFRWYIEFSVYFWPLIPNMMFIFYENEFLIVKISKYNHILVILLADMVKTTVLSYSATEKKTDT
jgi:hypothetical protein